ncbi:M56 family metallopeptidase [Ornithinimicrobium sp. W1665]|uniref:M56 family metallopeptidase n=1 Tax=Ornithinimicrobium sp. W1665 TaxID=3416666 RepID=UPI003CF5DE16
MTGVVVTAALILGALLLTLVAPHLLAGRTGLRAAPGPALLLWQAVSLAGVASALLAAPVAALVLPTDRPWLLAAAVVLSGLMLARLLWSGHRVGTDLRRRRARHRELVDLVGDRLGPGVDGTPTGVDRAGAAHRPSGPHVPRRHPVAVVAHASPTAYCLPGRDDRIVLSSAAVDRLDDDQLGAVLSHELAHLTQRHDLLLELFTVLHEAVPARVRADRALGEVHLLAEMLADRTAARSTGPTALARALVAMAVPAGDAPGRTGEPLGAGAGTAYLVDPGPAVGSGQVAVRVRALAAPPRPRGMRTGLITASLVVLLLPPALALLAVAG